MTDLTQLSISMAVYNSEGFIRERLESFGRQTHLSDELVKPSTDETENSFIISPRVIFFWMTTSDLRQKVTR